MTITEKFKPYTKYKDSGVQWIGKIPEGWGVKKIKHNTYVKGRIGWQGLKSQEFIDEGPYLVTGTDFVDGHVNWDSCYHVAKERYDQDPYIQLREKDLLITKDGTIGKTAIVSDMPDKSCLNSGIFLTRPLKPEYVSKYMYWLLNSGVFINFIDYMKTGTTINHLYQNVFVEFAYPTPEINVQTQIAQFLDHETSRIDKLIEKKNHQIELLKEKRSALISHAVTKGLNPNAKMKDSGVEWIGEIPEGWIIKKLKFIANINTGDKNTEDNIPDGKYPFFVRSQEIERLDTYTFDGEAILTAGDGVGVGKVFHYYNGKFDFHQRVYAITHFKKIMGKFLFYYLKANLMKDILKFNAKSTVDSLRLPMFRNFVVAFPNESTEQEEIAQFLDHETSKIDALISKIQLSNDRLKEYRTALISAAVTGKIDVRNWNNEGALCQ